MNRRHWATFIRITITLGLLVYVCIRAGVFDPQSRGRLLEMIAAVHPGYLAMSIGVGLVANVACAFKWLMLLRSRAIGVSLIRLYTYYMVGRFFNLVLPTSVGGDVVRMYELGRFTGRPADAVASVFVERFSGMVTLVVLALAAVMINLRAFNLPLITVALALSCAAIVVIGWLALDPRPVAAIRRLTTDRFRPLAAVLEKVEKIHHAVGAYRHDRGALWIAVANSLLFYLLAVINVWVSALAFAPQVDPLTMVVAVPMILLVMNLPVSIGGIGLMEFAYTLTFELVGYSSALGFSTALLMRFKTFLDAGVGGAFYLFLSRGRSLAGEVRQGMQTDRMPE